MAYGGSSTRDMDRRTDARFVGGALLIDRYRETVSDEE